MGGYFGMNLPDYGDPFPNALKFQSARAALRAVLENLNVKRVLLPVYICNVVVQAVIDSGAIVERYTLDDLFYPKGLPNPLPEDCILLYVNYFGLCDENVKRLYHKISKKQLIIDNSQALFASASNVMAAIYSIRKFIGVPDGGLLITSEVDVNIPENEDMDSLSRMGHLLLRLAYSARDGYLSFAEAEKSLNDTKPLKMSRLTKRLIASVDMGLVKRKRRENYLELAAKLDKFNEQKLSIETGSVPLCYPLFVGRNVDHMKQVLSDKGIFVPTYWSEIDAVIECDSIEYHLLHCCLFIPCDQRYSTSQMNVLAMKIILALECENEC